MTEKLFYEKNGTSHVHLYKVEEDPIKLNRILRRLLRKRRMRITIDTIYPNSIIERDINNYIKREPKFEYYRKKYDVQILCVHK